MKTQKSLGGTIHSKLCAASIALFLLHAPPAYSQESGKQIYNEAVKAQEEKKLDAACPLFNKSYQLFVQEKQQEGQLVALYALGFCEADTDRLLRAREHYQLFVSHYDKLSVPLKLKYQDDLKIINEQLANLRIPNVMLSLPSNSPPQGTRVLLDGKEIEFSALAKPIEVDPGNHVMQTDAPGHESWESKQISFAKGSSESIQLKWPTPVPPQPEILAGKQQERPGEGRRTAAIVVGGIGIAGLIAGSITGGIAMSSSSKVNAKCPNGTCDNDADVKRGTQTLMLANLSTAGFAIGLAGIATSAVLWFTGTKAKAANAPVNPGTLGVGFDGTTFCVRGRF